MTTLSWRPCLSVLPRAGTKLLVSISFDSETVKPIVKEAEFTGHTFRIGPNTISITGCPRATHWMPLPDPTTRR